MERLSSAQIKEYINPKAFAISRSTSTEANETARQRRILTSSLNESYSLVTGATNRLTDLRYNLQTMLEYAKAGAKTSSLPDYKYDEYFGALRSLTTGFEQVVEATKFNEKSIFDGRDVVLNMGGSTMKLDLKKLDVSGEGSLDLVKRTDGATVTVDYDVATLVRNQASGLVGLDLSDAKAVERTDFLPELEDGTYKLEIVYEGPESKLKLRDQFGKLLETKEGVDLSGSGQEKIRLKSGIELTIDKEQLLQSYDKWDYENEGPVSLHANLIYEKVQFHELQDGEAPANQTSSVEWKFKPTRKYTEPAVNLLGIETNGIDDGKGELTSGIYNMKVIYKGKKSVVELYDANGMMKSRVGGIDLTGQGKHDIDLGTGVRFTFENKGYSATDTKTLSATFSYTAADDYERDFDFAGYVDRINDAIKTIDDQLAVFDKAAERITQIYSWQQGTASGSNSGTMAMSLLYGAGASSNILGIMSSAGGTSGIMGVLSGNGQATSQLTAIATSMLGTISSASTASGNLSSSALSY